MSKQQRSAKAQKAINEAVEKIFDFFYNVMSYAEALETMSVAHVQLMELMETNRRMAANSEHGIESVPTDEICTFVYEVNEVYHLLRPFAKLMGQVYGNENVIEQPKNEEL